MPDPQEDPVLRAIREFRETLDSLPRVGVSQIAEVSQLRVLIGKYPGNAREFLAEIDQAHAARQAPPNKPI